MSLFGRDWNVIVITYERSNLYRINGNRGKGRDAVKIRDNAKRHAHTIYCAAFDQKGKLIEGEPGPAAARLPPALFQRLTVEFVGNAAVQHVLASLASGEARSAKTMEWDGYPSNRPKREEEENQPETAATEQNKPRAAPAQPKPRSPEPPPDETPDPSSMATVDMSSGTTFDLDEFSVGHAAVVRVADEDDEESDAMNWRMVVALDEGDEFESTLTLMQAGDRLTGTITAPDGGLVAIENPEMIDDNLMFEVAFPSDEGPMVLKMRGQLDGDTIRCVLI